MNRNDILFHLKYEIIPAQEFFADPEYWRETIRLLETDCIRSEPQQNLSAEQILFAPLATCSPKLQQLGIRFAKQRSEHKVEDARREHQRPEAVE
jgi:hypothetical protein